MKSHVSHTRTAHHHAGPSEHHHADTSRQAKQHHRDHHGPRMHTAGSEPDHCHFGRAPQTPHEPKHNK